MSKKPQFLSNQADIQATLPTLGLVILKKFHKDWQKIEDFLVIAKFSASLIFFASVSTSMLSQKINHSQIPKLQLTKYFVIVKKRKLRKVFFLNSSLMPRIGYKYQISEGVRISDSQKQQKF